MSVRLKEASGQETDVSKPPWIAGLGTRGPSTALARDADHTPLPPFAPIFCVLIIQ